MLSRTIFFVFFSSLSKYKRVIRMRAINSSIIAKKRIDSFFSANELINVNYIPLPYTFLIYVTWLIGKKGENLHHPNNNNKIIVDVSSSSSSSS